MDRKTEFHNKIQDIREEYRQYTMQLQKELQGQEDTFEQEKKISNNNIKFNNACVSLLILNDLLHEVE